MTLRERILAVAVAGGTLSALPAAPGLPQVESASPYFLPSPAGVEYVVTQAGGAESHTGTQQFAVDFAMSPGSAIVAARQGVIKFVRQDSNRCGCSAAVGHDGNYVVVDQGDGTQALYLHVAYNSAKVTVGDKVRRGQPLASSGMSGWTCGSAVGGCGPHLHFQVERSGIWFMPSVFLAFADAVAAGPSEGGRAHPYADVDRP